MDVRRIHVAGRPLDAVFRAVPSKSATHRALVAAALARGVTTIGGPLEADDTRITRDGIRALGVQVKTQPGAWVVQGRGGELPGGGELSLGESGTSMRLLVALASLGSRPSRLDGSARLRERPVQDLAHALRGLGASIRMTPGGGGLPLDAGGAPMTGGRIEVAGDRSSQFASALLAIGPSLAGGIDLHILPPAVSLPYVELTVEILREFGAQVRRVDELHWRVDAGGLVGREYTVEGDHSSASYFLAAPAVAGGRVRVEGLRPASRQPDARLPRLLERLGCDVRRGPDWIEVRSGGRIPGFEFDMGEAPDIVPTLAVLALFAEGPCRLSGIAHLRHKESDRLAVLAGNLNRLGRHAEVGSDSLVVGPSPERLRPATLPTASDHRMAMAFAMAGLRLEGVQVEEPGCVGKSNPDFWTQFARIEGS